MIKNKIDAVLNDDTVRDSYNSAKTQFNSVLNDERTKKATNSVRNKIDQVLKDKKSKRAIDIILDNYIVPIAYLAYCYYADGTLNKNPEIIMGLFAVNLVVNLLM